MNPKNVDALSALLVDAACDRSAQIWSEDATGPFRISWLRLAEWLAARGVLVPSALTDEQARRMEIAADVDFDGTSTARYSPSLNRDFDGVVGASIRAELERIAKGEASETEQFL